VATVVWDEPSTAADSSSPAAADRRPLTIWAAIGLALASGVFVFVVDLRLSLQTNALVAALPPGSPAPVDPALSALAIWAPAIVGGVVLLAYVLVARRLNRRHPRAARATIIVASIYIAFSLFNLVAGRVTVQATVALALNGALIALVMIPASRNYLKGGPSPSF